MSEPPLVVLVGGLPAAGKTTLARALAAELAWPLLSKDVIKETLYDVLGIGDRAWSRRLGAAASESLWALLAEQHSHVILESVFSSSERPLIVRGLESAPPRRAVQVVCACPPEEALRRFWQRVSDGERHPGHAQSPAQVDAQDEARWEHLAADSFDLGIGPVLRVDTVGEVDVPAVACWLRAAAGDR